MRLRVGILGTGKIAVLMAETIQHMSETICYAVASRSEEKANVFAQMYGFEKAYGTYEELVKDEKVDLVYVATPHSEHYQNAKMAMHHKKAVLCEKAFTVNAKQAKELMEISTEMNVFITEAIWTRYMPMRKMIIDYLEKGYIGEPKMITANVGYDISGVPRIMDPSLAGGGLLDVGVYPLNFAAMIFGTDIKTIAGNCTYSESGVDEQAGIVLEYKDGKMAVLNYSICSISDKMGIIYGTKGHMIVHNINNFAKISIYNNKYELIEEVNRPEQFSGYEYEIMACIQALQNEEIECPQMSHQETIKMMEIIDCLREKWSGT